MHFFASILASTAIFGSLSTASPLETRQEALKPFEVTAVTSYSPSGRPGSDPCTQPFKLNPNTITHKNMQGFISVQMSLTPTHTSSPAMAAS